MSRFSRQWILDEVRERYHPVHALRRVGVLRRLARFYDVQLWTHVEGVSHPVRVYALRNVSYLLDRRPPEPRITALMLAILETCHITRFWDIGANIGYYSWLIHSARPDVQVLAVEPDVTNFALLKRTQVHAPSVEVLNAAISNVDGNATFAVDSVSGATGTLETTPGTFNERYYHETRRSTTIDTRSLDSLADGRGLPDLIKIDVEGHESAVVAGAQLVLRSSPMVMIEAFEASAPALATLRTAGFYLVDASTLSDDAPRDGNYLAIPRAHLSLLAPLRRAYLERLAGVGLRASS
jgi:FkbM family methyltransferase